MIQSLGEYAVPLIPCRGDIWFADLGEHPKGCVIGKCRPVLIISNNKGNQCGNTITVLPITSGEKHLHLPTHIEVFPENFICWNYHIKHSTVLVEQITTLDKRALRSFVGRINSKTIIEKIQNAIKVQLGI